MRLLESFGQAVVAWANSIGQGLKWIFIPLWYLGQVEMVRRKPAWRPIVFISLLATLHTIVLLGLFVGAGYIAHRHVLPLVGLAMPFTALGVLYLANLLTRLKTMRPATAKLATLAVCTAVVLPYTLRPFCHEFVPVIEATRWVQAHAEPGSGIICNSPYVAFYGTLPTAVLGPESPTLEAAVGRATAEARYDYVVLHVNAHAYQPEWLAMIEKSYRPVLTFPDPESPASRPRKVLVFESKTRQAHRETGQSQS